MSHLQRTGLALENVKDHISKNQHQGGPSAIDSYLVHYLAVVFYSEMEERVEEIIRERLICQGDQKLAYFISKTKDGMIKRIKKSNIADLVASFGDSVRDEFNKIIADHEITWYEHHALRAKKSKTKSKAKVKS